MAELRILPRQETVAQRVRRLQAEAKQIAREHSADLASAMADLCMLASEISVGGDAYPPGVREVARSLAEDLENRGLTLVAIINRT